VQKHADPPEDQNSEEQASNFQMFSDGFQQALQDIGRAVFVLSPWNKPEWIFRIWCLSASHKWRAPAAANRY
jgi:hypothetical protein